MVQENKIPKATVKRLPLYYRYLEKLHLMGIERVSSSQLSKELLIDSATIRRDFSYLGELGVKGYGYKVDYLINFLSDFLKHDEDTNVIIIGVGNLGTALLNYNFYRNRSTKIVAAFDNDINKINKEIEEVPIYSLDELEKKIKELNVEVAILTVPVHAAQKMADRIVSTGIKGILNFTPSVLSVPNNIRVHYIDLTIEMQNLVYFIKYYDDEESFSLDENKNE